MYFGIHPYSSAWITQRKGELWWMTMAMKICSLYNLYRTKKLWCKLIGNAFYPSPFRHHSAKPPPKQNKTQTGKRFPQRFIILLAARLETGYFPNKRCLPWGIFSFQRLRLAWSLRVGPWVLVPFILDQKLRNFYLEYEHEFKSFVKFGTWYIR